MKMYGYIYLTICLQNLKIYIGQHCSEVFNESYHGSGVKFRKALKKYGNKNFKTILIEPIYTNQQDLNKREQFWIKKYNSTNPVIGYNLDLGGTCLGKHSELTKEKIKKSETGKIVSDLTRQKLSIAMKKRLFNKSEKEKLIKYLGTGMLGKSQSIKQKLAVSKANKGKKLSAETINKLSKSRAYAGECAAAVCRKQVICLELNKIFNSIGEANEFFGKPKKASSITNALKNHAKTAFGYHWKYLKEYEQCDL